MPRLIRLNLLDLAMEVDPRQQDGTLFIDTTVCVQDGEKFPKQRLLDIYNQARMAFLVNNANANGQSGLFQNGGTVKLATGTLSYSAPTVSLTKPADFISLLSLIDTADAIQIVVLPPALYGDVLMGRNAHLAQSIANKQVYMFNVGQTISIADANLSALNGKAYSLMYVGCTLWVLANVDASTQETIEDSYWPIVKEIAVRLANNAGNAEIDALALSLIRGGR